MATQLTGVGRRFLVALAAWSFFSGFFVGLAPIGAATSEEIAFRRLFFGLQPPIDRDAERLVELILELLQDGRVSEAAPLIEARLAANSDHFSAAGRSLKAVLSEALDELPAPQLRRLQSVLSASHNRRMTAAKTTADWRRLVAESPASLYGAQALAELARIEEDAGAYHAADRAYRAAEATAGKGSQLASWLSERGSANRHRFGAEGTVDPASSAAGIASRLDRVPAGWCGAGGDATRQGRGDAVTPRRWCDWRVELSHSGVEPGSTDDSPGGFASGDTVAVAGVLVTRIEDGLVAIDSRSGKRVWRCDLLSKSQGGLSAVERGLSSDGLRVYAVADNQQAEVADSFWQRPRLRQGEQATTNALVAFDLPRQGKIAWRIDGSVDRGPLAGARFLGPPAADEGRLYALVDLRQVISLVEIDARNGSIEWMQPLAGRPNGRGAEAAVSPISPTVGENRVYCPTGAGAVVAVDPLRRQLVWTHYFSISKATARRAKSRGWRRNAWYNAANAWRNARVVEHAGTLTVVSPAATILETLDAETGQSLWSHSHKSGRLLAAVTPDLVVLVESERIVGRDRVSGKRVWSSKLPSDDPPAGEGLLLGDRYLLPLVSGQLALVPLQNESRGAPELIRFDLNPLEGPPVLGNLLCYQEAIYSRSDHSLVRLRPGGKPRDVFDRAIDALARSESVGVRELLGPVLRANPTDLVAAEVVTAATLLPGSGGGNPLDYASGPRAEAHGTLLRLAESLRESDPRRAARLIERFEQTAYHDTVMRPEPGWAVAADRLMQGRFRAAAAEPGWSADVPSRGPRGAEAANPAWSLRQIEARSVEEDQPPTQPRSNGRRRPRRSRQAPLAVWQPDTANGPIHWHLETHQNGASLIGRDRWGDPQSVLSLPSSFRSPARPPSLASDRRPQAMQWGDRIAVPLEGVTAVFSLTDNALAWSTESGGREETETPVAIGPWGVITKKDHHLACRRLAGGEIAWERDFEEGRSLYPRVLSSGDDLFVATSRQEGIRLSAWSGERHPQGWTPPRSLLWGSQFGENFYAVEPRSGPDGTGLRDLLVLRVAQPEQPVLEVVAEAGSQLVAVNGGAGLVAILDEELELTVVDVASASVRFQRVLPGDADSAVRSLRARLRRGSLLIEVDRSNPTVYRREGFSPIDAAPLLTGELHCLDAETGEPLWEHPAEVSAMSLLSPQADCPLLLLARRKAPDAGSNQAEATLSLVALDPATGASVYRNHAVAAGDESRGERPVRVQRERGGPDRLIVRLGRTVITLTPTGPPAPPRPHYVARIEDPHGDQAEGRDGLPPAAGQLLKRLLGD